MLLIRIRKLAMIGAAVGCRVMRRRRMVMRRKRSMMSTGVIGWMGVIGCIPSIGGAVAQRVMNVVGIPFGHDLPKEHEKQRERVSYE